MPRSSSLTDRTEAAIRELQITYLKRKARQAYERYSSELGRYDCGAALSEYVNPRVTPLKQEFNTIMDQLATFDPTTPATRL
jgi:hypothetical protein